MKYVFMAGGTGGHVYPALAVARALQADTVQIHWIGTRAGFEARAVPQAGIPLEWIDVQGVRGKAGLSLLFAPLRIARAVWQAWRILRRLRPSLVVGMGGYASGPGGLAAWLLRIPLLIHEQNARAGSTNRILARFAGRVLQAYPETFAPGIRAQTVGNPVRAELLALPPPAARGLGQRERLQVLVLGGSQGALALNRAVPAAMALIDPAQRPRVRHQAGRTLAAAHAAYRQAGVDAEIVEFVEDMAEAYAWADLVICRAGALTLAEVAAVGLGSILVPFPAATDDHQTCNAEYLVAAGAARLLPEAQLSPQQLTAVIRELAADPAHLLAMGLAARGCAFPQATHVIAGHCRALAGAVG